MLVGGPVPPLSAAARGGRRHRVALVAAVACFVVAADQVTKSLVVAGYVRPRHLFGPLSIELTYNSGIAFSLASGFGLPIVLLGVAAVVVVVLRRRDRLTVPRALGFGLVTGGALSNIADRLFRPQAAVVDFLHLSFWPTFNVADSAVVVGCAVLFFALQGRARAHPEGDPR